MTLGDFSEALAICLKMGMIVILLYSVCFAYFPTFVREHMLAFGPFE